VVLAGVNTYSGGTNLNGGILAVNNDGNLGTGQLNFNGGTLEALVGGGGITSSKAITLLAGGGTFSADATTFSTLSGGISGVGSFTKSGAGVLFLTATNTYTGGTTISGGALLIGNGGASGSIVGDVLNNGTLAFNRSDNITFGGVISGTGVLDQFGPGTLTLTGANSYSGGTMVVNNSVLRVDNNAELCGPAGGITLQGGELLTTGAAFTTARAIVVNTASGPDILAASTGTTATYSGAISGGGGLVVGDPGDTGTVVLTGANTYTGGTTVSGATLSVANDGNLGVSSSGLTLNGGELLATGNLFNTSRAIVVTANNGTLAAATGGLGEFAGNIATSGGLTIGDGVNNGTVVLSGTNTYATTTTIVTGATLRVDAASALSPNSAFTVDGTLDLRGSLSQVGSLSGAGKVTNQSGQGAALTAGSDNSSTNFSGVIEDGGNPVGLTKTGGGTLILSGTSTYTGATDVSVGRCRWMGFWGIRRFPWRVERSWRVMGQSRVM
jgi:fibronectin-binding autotransporter adhesin